MVDIYCDVDGVIYNINKLAIEIANEENDTFFDYRNNKDWWWLDYIRATKCGSKRYFENMLDREGFFYEGDLIEGAYGCISKLHEKGFNIRFISAPHWTNKHFMKERVEFLSEVFRWFEPSKHLILTSDKGVCDGKNRVLIDDYPHNLKSFKVGTPICFGQPYNEDYNGLRFNTWKEIYNYLIKGEN